MLEVVFNDSIKDSMKVAKRLTGKNIVGEDVVCIGFFLDIGEISGHVDGSNRQKLFKNLWSHGEFNEKEIEEMIKENKLEIVSDNKTSHPYEKILRKAKL